MINLLLLSKKSWLKSFICIGDLEEVTMENTQEISLINLFWRLLFGWRRMIALGIIVATIISGLKYVSDQVAWKQQSDTDIEEVELLFDEQAKINDILALQKQMDEVRNYQQNSIWMNLDAYNENVLILRYYVDSDYIFNYTQENESDYTKDVIAAYCSYVTSGIVADAVAKELNLLDQINYISELITAEGGDAEDRSRNVFEIVVAYSNAEILEQLKSVITRAVEGQTERIVNEVGSHTLKLVTENITVRVDKNLILTQKEKNDTMYNFHVQLAALQANLSEEQKTVLDKEREAESGTEESDDIMLIRPSLNIKYVLFGFIVGVFLACVWVFLEVLFATKMQNAEEMSELYKVRILGEIEAQNRKKQIFHVVDSLLLKWKNHNKKQISQEQKIRIAGSNIEIACKKAGINQLYVTGSEIDNQKDKSAEKIWRHLSESGIQVHRGENVVYDAGALKEMAEIGSVIFLEQVGVSLYAEVEKEMKAAKDNGIQIIGSVIIS